MKIIMRIRPLSKSIAVTKDDTMGFVRAKQRRVHDMWNSTTRVPSETSNEIVRSKFRDRSRNNLHISVIGVWLYHERYNHKNQNPNCNITIYLGIESSNVYKQCGNKSLFLICRLSRNF